MTMQSDQNSRPSFLQFFAKSHRTNDAFDCGGNRDADVRVAVRFLKVKRLAAVAAYEREHGAVEPDLLLSASLPTHCDQ